MTDNAKELLALAEYHERQCNRHVNGYCATVRCMKRGGFERGGDMNVATCEEHETATALRLSARQQASVEEVARSLCKADGTAQCTAICLSYSSTSTTNGKCPEAKRIWGHKCRALLAKYDIFEKVEG